MSDIEAVFRRLGIAVIILDLEGKITYFNPAAEISSGYAAATVLGKKPWDFLISKEDAPLLEQAFENLKSTLMQTEMETIWTTNEGRQRTFRWSNAPVLNEAGAVHQIINIFADVTNERESERNLKTTREALEAEQTNARFLSDTTFRIYAEDLDRKTRLELITSLAVPFLADWCFAVLPQKNGVGYLASAHHADEKKAVTIRKLLVSQGEHDLARLAMQQPGSGAPEELAILQELGWASRIYLPISSRAPSARGGILFSCGPEGTSRLEKRREVAESFAMRAAALLDNAALYEEANHALRLRDEFIAAASHELRTPLTSLRMQVDLLKTPPARDFLETPLGKRILHGADQQLARISKLVLTMLDSVYVTRGKLKLEYAEFDLRELIQDILIQTEVWTSRSGTSVRLLPGPAVHGNWDHFRIEQVVVNLLSNAVKYGNHKPVEITIEADGERALLQFVDHGPGIAKEDHERIFQRFEQVSAGDSAGLGLGLYISRQIVRAHGGEIRIDSKPGLGSRFTVDLPLRPAAQTHGETPTLKSA